MKGTNAARRELYVPTYFGRQPIFNADGEVWGFELLYRDTLEATCATFSDDDAATLTVAATAFVHPGIAPGEKRNLLVTFSRKCVLGNMPFALPARDTVIKVHQPERPDTELVQALRKLKLHGYAVAVDNFSGDMRLDALYEVADILIIDTLGKTRADVRRLAARATIFDGAMLAKRVEDHEALRMAEEIGFPLFQGFYFQKPEVVPGRTLTSNEISRLNLMALIEREEADFDELAETIQTDVSISYRLLAYLNSPAFNLPSRIGSIKQAVILLGWNRIRSWLRLVILTDLVPPGKSSELPYLSAVRGRFLADVGPRSLSPEARQGDDDRLFLLGLLSLLDAMLDTPMPEIVGNLPLEELIKAALLGEPNIYSFWLELARCFETGNWNELDVCLKRLKLEPGETARSYFDALLWANTFFQNSA